MLAWAVNIARHYVVEGRVQGVGFRWFVHAEATALKLTGYVRNLPGGRVEVLAQGSAAALDELAGKLERGPFGARVTGVNASEAPLGKYKSFDITH